MLAHIVIDGEVQETRDALQVKWHLDARQTLWVELEERTPETDALLTEVFQLHPVVSEDIWLDRVVPKVEAFPRYLHILLFGVRPGERPSRVTYWGLNVVLGATWVITLRSRNATPAPDVARCQTLLRNGPAHLAHAFLDDVVDGHVAFAEVLGKRIDQLTEDTFRSQGTAPTGAVFDLRRALRVLARLARRQLDAITTLYQGEFAVMPGDTRPYVRDVYDHFILVTDLVEDYQTEVQNVLDGLASVQSARTNTIMKSLTLLSTVMLPLNFIASVFGMNFKHIPLLDSRAGFPAALALMVSSTVGFVLWFHRKHWV